MWEYIIHQLFIFVDVLTSRLKILGLKIMKMDTEIKEMLGENAPLDWGIADKT